MAVLNAPSVNETQFSGQYGNASVATGSITLNAAQVNDQVLLLKLFAGSRITSVRMVNAALGAGVAVDLGVLALDGSVTVPTQFFTAQATSSPGSNISASRAYTLQKDSFIVATIKGGVANGYLDVVVDYEFRGK